MGAATPDGRRNFGYLPSADRVASSGWSANFGEVVRLRSDRYRGARIDLCQWRALKGHYGRTVSSRICHSHRVAVLDRLDRGQMEPDACHRQSSAHIGTQTRKFRSGANVFPRRTFGLRSDGKD